MDFRTEYYKLPNGVRVLEVPMEGVESVVSLALVRTGSRNEQPKQAGISHVLEHMVFKGTKKYPTPLDIATTVDSMGAQFNAFTGKEYTGYYIKSAGNHIEKSLDVLSQFLTAPRLKQDDLDREKGVIIEEINMYEDLPMERAGEEFENLMYEGSDLGRLIIGKKKTVTGVNSGDLREYMKKWYRGGNVLVVVAGKVGSAGKLIEEKFGSMADGGIDAHKSKGMYGKKSKFHLKKKTEQAHFVLGVPGLKFNDPGRYSLLLLQIILGGNMSSRLFTEIREKRGLAYYVKASAERYFDVGHLAVRAGVKLDALDEAVNLVRRELLGISKSVTKEELAQVKEYFKGVFVLSLEDPLNVAKFIGEWALAMDEVREPGESLMAVSDVSLEQVREIAGELLSEDKIKTVVVGPKGV